MTGVISYPIPAYQNYPINADFYQPSRFVISAIALGKTTTVTTTTDMNYVVGQLVRLIIPIDGGCRQLNESQGYVISIPASNQVTLDIYSAGGDSFTTPTGNQQAQILAIGDIGNGQINSNGRTDQVVYVPGSFINISPQ